MGADIESLEQRVGHCFSDRALLRRALTHSSHAHENPSPGDASPAQDNEQLEFLGDSVLGFLISEVLVARYPDWSEGRLSSLKAHLVSAVHLHKVAQAIELGAYLHLGRSEELTGGRTKRTLLVNALEALIAAAFLDGGIDVARAFVLREVFDASFPEPGTLADYKTALQDLARLRKLPLPRYTVVNEQGPEHSKTFIVEVRLGKDLTALGDGASKKSAAQKAAREVYQRLLDPPAAP